LQERGVESAAAGAADCTGIAGPGLIAQIVVTKFGDHLPLYRQEDIFVRHGLHIARSTMCDWVSAAAELFEPLFELQRRLVLQSAVMWTDDTPVKVLTGGEEGSRLGRFWTYIGDSEHLYSVYDFRPRRSAKLHAEVSGLSPRRRLCGLRRDLPGIGQLYDIEDRARELPADSRCELRCAEANPVLDRLEAYLAQLATTLLPKIALAKAVTYARNQWNALRRSTTDGRLTIDNNVSERTLRHQAIGRKNWLFLGSKNAGPRAAVLYTILAGAKRHRIEPWAYVRELLMQLHAEDPQLEEMLPDRWAAAHPEAVLTHRLEESRAKAANKRDRRRRRRRVVARHQR
jgi:transposase